MAWGELDHYFGVSSDQLRSNAAPTRNVAGPSPTGSPGTYASFTDWRRSPVFWVAVFAVFALAMIHAEGAVAVRLRVR
jgi:hypothetical protein